MTSVQNLRPRLNGNKWSIIAAQALVCLFLGACSTSKSVMQPKQSQQEKKVESKVLEKPKADSLPVKKNIEVTTPEKKDTVIYQQPPKKEPEPVRADSFVLKNANRSSFNILLIAPFRTSVSDSLLPESVRFLQFYAGIQMALSDYDRNAAKGVHLLAVDEGGKAGVEKRLTSKSEYIPDCVIGPYDIEALKYAAEWGRTNQTLVVSPWISSSSITGDNPFYLQIKAGLNTQFKTIGKHVLKNYETKNVFVVGKTVDDPRLKHFKREAGYDFQELILKEEELATSQDILLESYFQKDKPVVFVLPQTSAKDENFVYHFLRRVISEKLDREVIVYGTHRWLDYKEEIVDFINKLNARICLSNFMQVDAQEVDKFRLRYYDVYREFPRSDAFEGYDLMQFLLYTVNHESSIGTFKVDMEPKYFQTKFKIDPVSKDDNDLKLDYFENGYAKIVKMDQYKLVIVE